MSHAVRDEQIRPLVDALPGGFLKAYCNYAAKASDAPLIYHVGVGLSLLAATLPPDLHMWGAGVPIYSNLYTLIIGDSALARKSVSLGIGENLLRNVEPALAPTPPGSYEGLLSSLTMQPQQLIVESEFARFMSQARDSHIQALKIGYMDVFDCRPVGRTLSRETQSIVSPRLSILGAIAPSLFERFVEPEDLTGGFLSRFVILYGERTTYRRPAPHDEVAWRGLQGMLNHRLRSLPNARAAFDPSTDDAYWSWVESIDKYARSLDHTRSGLVVRGGTLGLKIAMLLGADLIADLFPATNPGGGRPMAPDDYCYPLPSIALELGKQIAALHVSSGLGIIESLAPDPDMRLRRDVLRTVTSHYQTKGYATEGEVARGTKSTIKRLRPIIETLIAEARIVVISVDGTGGRMFALPPNDPLATRD